VSVCVSP